MTELERVEKQLEAANRLLAATVELVNKLEQDVFELRQQEKAAK